MSLRRIALKDTYTIGKLYLNEIYFCDVLEDKVRPNGEKIYGQTAIPYGNYSVKMTMSNRFKKVLPLIENVKGFAGIRIHAGNTTADTLGCLLVGKNDIKGKVTNSRHYSEELNKILIKEKNITIEII